ncbi:aspartate aminotransferase family protein [Methyloligella sp. 2.7D]|uniref:aspartate aminotransferase family protein n=1 Tax=unclassified Methyloligella TaxID=2625955 RepID=UPI00157C75D4|nr:aspartate aminotransferase family protein [Methyloligella sp. GL2]QKP76911.1 aspartate aminotransferase family protein [Methyloligella sp. GL2]
MAKSGNVGILELNAYRESAGEKIDPLLQRHLANSGAASVLFYQEPIEMVSARGVWMEDAGGTRYLDFYNNVPSVGHCHPRVVEAVSAQIATLNIHTRYLNAKLEAYIEALKATLPDALSNVVLACSGSEANDLAMRVAMKATDARGFVVTDQAYHGNTALVTEVSPAAFLQGALPDHVVAIPAPDLANFEGEDLGEAFASALSEAAAELKRRGHGFAGFICDSIFSSDGIFPGDPGFLQKAVAATHAAGGLYIADEVQPGFARTGEAFWGFGRHGVTPDIVTMGKPMGNGFPMAGMVARPDLLAGFCNDVGYFNTFGGNPVAACAGLAVLEVIAEEGLQENARLVGGHLKEKLDGLAETIDTIGAVRGAGLFIGVDIETDGAPDAAKAKRIIEGLKQRRVLAGAAGKHANTLKLRPPLCLSEQDADFFFEALAETLKALPTET